MMFAVVAALTAFFHERPAIPVSTSVRTNAVVASCVVLVPGVAVGAVGVPVSPGDARSALRLNAVCCAVDTGLLASEVLSTFASHTLDLAREVIHAGSA